MSAPQHPSGSAPDLDMAFELQLCPILYCDKQEYKEIEIETHELFEDSNSDAIVNSITQ